MFTSLLRIVLIVGIAAGAGFIRARDLTWIPNVKELEAEQKRRAELRAELGITLERFQELIDQGAVVIDARPAEDYEEGHLALDTDPPVLNMPAEEIEAQAGRLSVLEGLPVVLYCASERCEDAEELYEGLARFGFAEIWIYFPGWEGILEADLPITSGPDTWRGFEDAMQVDEAFLEANAPNEVVP